MKDKHGMQPDTSDLVQEECFDDADEMEARVVPFHGAQRESLQLPNSMERKEHLVRPPVLINALPEHGLVLQLLEEGIVL